ncbi:hypothetical protein GS444_13325 [Rhodococcus hoagii]|nr:hypothetical protein [Prescottella equi]
MVAGSGAVGGDDGQLRRGPGPASPGAGRVEAAPDGLYLDGEKWWPAGFNAYQLSTNWGINRGCGGMVDLPEYFDSLPPHSLTRFNAFQELAINKFTVNWTSPPWTRCSRRRNAPIR